MVVPTASTCGAAWIRAQACSAHLVALAVELVLRQICNCHRPEGVEADVQGDSLEVEALEQLRREVQAGGRRRSRALVSRVDGLVALRILQRLGNVRRQRRLARRLALQPQPPAALAQRLEQLDRAEPLPGLEFARRAREPLPGAVLAKPLQQEHLGGAPTRALEPQTRRQHPRVVDDDERPFRKLARKLVEAAMPGRAVRALVHEQPRVVAPRHRVLGDQLRG